MYRKILFFYLRLINVKFVVNLFGDRKQTKQRFSGGGFCFLSIMSKFSPVQCSLIISVYKNTVFLRAVLDSLLEQTFRNFEVIISEDGDSAEMADFLSTVSLPYPLIHLSQPDEGWNKNRALNRAVKASTSDWLVFIDGDCVLHPRFMEFHWRRADEKCILAGKRIKLDPYTSQQLIDGSLSPDRMNAVLLRRISSIRKNGGNFVEEGVFIDPDGWMGFITRMRKMRHLKGCNMSFHKRAVEAINGFDEAYRKPAVGEDADLLWRFLGLGYELRSVRNVAVQYHLYHKESWSDQEENLSRMKNNQKEKKYICDLGLRS